jgi:hypothetical protein
MEPCRSTYHCNLCRYKTLHRNTKIVGCILGTIKDRDVRINVSVNASGLDEIERRLSTFGSIAASLPGGGVTPNPSGGSTTDGGGGRSSRDQAYVPQLAEGGIVPARPGGTLVNIGEGGSPEAVIPLGKWLGTTITSQSKRW